MNHNLLFKTKFIIAYFCGIGLTIASTLNAQSYKPFNLSEEFPNYLGEGVDLNNERQVNARIRLIERCMQSVMNRVQIPHVMGNKLVREDFFTHLLESLDPLVPHGSKLDVFISGGVVRTLLAFIYKQVYEKKYKNKEEISQRLPSRNSVEFLLKKLYIDKTPLESTFVLGVGSDFDTLITLEPRNEEVEEKIKNEIIRFVNSARTMFNIGQYSKEIVASLVPAADVNIYSEQINRVVEHGGSSLDILAFKIAKSSKPKEEITPSEKFQPEYYKYSYAPSLVAKIVEPAKRQGIMKLFVAGQYEYWPDLSAAKEHLKTLRGLRPLFELPFLRLKNSSAILKELQELLAKVKQSGSLDAEDQASYEKMVRNAYFSGARNRAYREKGEAAYLAMEISEYLRDKLGVTLKIRRLFPEFLSYERIVSNRNGSGKYRHDVDNNLTPLSTFKENYTDNGILYHGTTTEHALSILRNGFVLSNAMQGAAAYGPGVYTTKDMSISQGYGDFIIRIKLTNNESMRILEWNRISDKIRGLLEEEKAEDEYSDVFDMLREKYNIDIIVNEYVLVQNLSAIKPEKNMANLIDALGADISAEEAKYATDEFIQKVKHFLATYELGAALFAKSMFDRRHFVNKISAIIDNYILDTFGKDFSIHQVKTKRLIIFSHFKNYLKLFELAKEIGANNSFTQRQFAESIAGVLDTLEKEFSIANAKEDIYVFNADVKIFYDLCKIGKFLGLLFDEKQFAKNLAGIIDTLGRDLTIDLAVSDKSEFLLREKHYLELRAIAQNLGLVLSFSQRSYVLDNWGELYKLVKNGSLKNEYDMVYVLESLMPVLTTEDLLDKYGDLVDIDKNIQDKKSLASRLNRGDYFSYTALAKTVDKLDANTFKRLLSRFPKTRKSDDLIQRYLENKIVNFNDDEFVMLYDGLVLRTDFQGAINQRVHSLGADGFLALLSKLTMVEPGVLDKKFVDALYLPFKHLTNDTIIKNFDLLLQAKIFDYSMGTRIIDINEAEYVEVIDRVIEANRPQLNISLSRISKFNDDIFIKYFTRIIKGSFTQQFGDQDKPSDLRFDSRLRELDHEKFFRLFDSLSDEQIDRIVSAVTDRIVTIASTDYEYRIDDMISKISDANLLKHTTTVFTSDSELIKHKATNRIAIIPNHVFVDNFGSVINTIFNMSYLNNSNQKKASFFLNIIKEKVARLLPAEKEMLFKSMDGYKEFLQKDGMADLNKYLQEIKQKPELFTSQS